MGVIERTTCRACGGNWAEVWDLGKLELNDFPASMREQKHPAVPLVLCRCHPCGLLQLKHTTPPEWMFQEQYWYRSGTNEAMRRHLREVVDRAREMVPVTSDDVVIDIGANDGTLLSYYAAESANTLVAGRRPQVPVQTASEVPFRVAFEPAINLIDSCSRHSEIAIADFFPPRVHGARVEQFRVGGPAASYDWRPAKIITSAAMFYDLDDPGAFVAEIKRLLHPNGIWVNQLAYLPAMLRNNAWDSVCHEHLCYYSLHTLAPLYLKHGLQIVDVEEVPVNEGSLRVYATHRDGRVPIEFAAIKRVRDLAARETELDLAHRNEPYFSFRAEAERMRMEIKKFFLGTVLKGETVDLIGASTKGNTYLQYCGIDARLVRRAIERAPEKVGRHTVTGIPIVSEEQGRKNPAKWILVPIWAFRDSIVERERGKWPAGTKLIFPMPKLEVVEL